MHKMTKTCLKTLLVISAATLYGCGGGSSSGGGGGVTYSGNTSPASVDADNAEAIGQAAGEAVEQAAGSSSLSTSPLGIEVNGVNTDQEALHKIIYDTSQLALLPSGINVSDEVCLDGGSANVSYSGSGATTGNGPLNMRITYNNCANGNYTISGTVRVEYENIGSDTSGFTIEYNNVTVSGYGYGTQTLNYAYSCTNASDFSSCTSYSVFESSDGGNHRVSEYSFSGNSSSGYNGSATFSHETYGSVSITVSGITYGNCGSSPDGGTVSFSSSNGTSGQITFTSDCTVYGSWNDGSVSGSFGTAPVMVERELR